jgi:hypothetical protein
MTDYRGVAVATQALSHIAYRAIHAVIDEAEVTVNRPEEQPAASRDTPRLNIYLIQVGVEGTMRNSDLPTRDANGRLMTVPDVPLTLRYLLSYFGPFETAHVMLGAIEVAFHESPVLEPAAIVESVANHRHLKGSGLDQQRPPVRIIPSTISLEELSRFWSGFFQVPYTLSTVHELSPVILSSQGTPSPALPVRHTGTSAGGMPPQLDPLPTVTYADDLAVPVSGPGVAPGQLVGIDDTWVPIDATSEGTLSFEMPQGTPPGSHTVRLGSDSSTGAAPAPLPGTNTQTLQVRPQVTDVTFDRASRTVTVSLGNDVVPGQRVELSLMGTGDQARAFSVGTTITTRTNEVEFTVPATRRGKYLAILTVDGVPSELGDDGSHYSEPAVALR